MKRTLFTIAVLAVLSACGDSRKEELAWGERCLRAGFNGDQCGLMLEQLKASREASSAADFAAAMSSVAVGVAAGKR